MANITSEEECLLSEETGRRTRSGRKSSLNSSIPGLVKGTRRSVRKSLPDELSLEDNNLATVIELKESNTMVEHFNESESSKKDMTTVNDLIAADKKLSSTNSTYVKNIIQTELKSAATNDEENRSSSDLDDGIIKEHLLFRDEIMEKHLIDKANCVSVNDDEMIETEQVEDTPIAEDKSSSFPFACDVSTGKMDLESELVEPPQSQVDSIDNLLANLAEDNANSLPSAGGGEDDDGSRSPKVVIKKMSIDDKQESVKTSIKLPDVINDNSKVTDLQMSVVDDVINVGSKNTLEAIAIQTNCNVAELNLKISKRKLDQGYDPNSPTEESIEVSPIDKKSKIDDDDEDSLEALIKKDPEQDKKLLPDLEKYWKTVNDNPADFTGWTYLLQYVDQENDLEAARDAYDAFLSHYPYCYGYWRKYADYEKRKGNKSKCDEVFERGLAAIPLSVDLWIHYITHAKSKNSDDVAYIRSQFERAIGACGLEFRSDKLWEAYIKWEKDGARNINVIALYDRLLATPTQGYSGHFDHFQEVINNNPLSTLITLDEMSKLRAEVRCEKTIKEKHKNTEISDMPPGEDDSDYNVRNEEEAVGIKEKLIAPRRKIHKQTVSAVTGRWVYEEGIKRPYFHVKPLERCQLKNWKDYIDFEIEHGDRQRVLVLFERCLIACALYDEFWLKLIRYLESLNDSELIPSIRDVFQRACEVHHPDKPSLHLMWSAFEECQNDFDKAAKILIKLEENCSDLLQIAYRRINVERRRKNFEKCVELYEHYIRAAKNKTIAGSLAIKYARFCHKVMNNLESGYEVLRKALHDDPTNTRVALQMIDMSLQRTPVKQDEVVAIMDSFMGREDIESDQRVLFAQRKVEFLEDFGENSKGLQEAQRALHVALNKANEAKKKASESSHSKKSLKESVHQSGSSSSPSSTTAVLATSSQSTSYNYNYTSPGTGFYQGTTANVNYPGYGDYSGYNYYQAGYSNYGQWSGQGGNQGSYY